MTDDTSIGPPIALSAGIDRDAARTRFAETGRVQIKSVLDEQVAQGVLKAFTTKLEWGITYNQGAESKHIPREQIEFMTNEERSNFLSEVTSRAMEQFQFAFAEAPLMQDFKPGQEVSDYAHRMIEFVNDVQFQSLIADVTGDDQPARADLIACCYSPGHFITLHDDKDPQGLRRYGFAFDFTPFWRPDWGGSHLFFDDEDGNVTEGFNPVFNSLNLFRVPQRYAISFVAPYAKAGRYTLAGWVQSIPQTA